MRPARPWTYGRVLAVWMTACVLSILLLGPLSELAPPVAARVVALRAHLRDLGRAPC